MGEGVTREKFVVRLLDKEGALLSWAEVYAEPKPQERGASCPLWPIGPTQFIIDQSGMASQITIHWCDLDVARSAPPLLEPVKVEAGQVFTFTWIEPLWLVAGMRDVPLPGVTMRASVTLSVPTGQLMGVGR